MSNPEIRIKKFSEQWIESSFSDVFEILKNNSLSRAELSDKGTVYNIHYGDVLINYDECLIIDKRTIIPFIKNQKQGIKLHQSSSLKNGDIVFADAAEDNTVGKCTEIISSDKDAIVAGLHTIPCRPKANFAPGFLGFFLNSDAFHNQLLGIIQGTKVSSISKKSIKNTIVKYPSYIEEQESISRYMQVINTLLNNIQGKIDSLKQIKSACLQSMFPQQGESVPKVRFKGFQDKWERTPLKAFAHKCIKKNTNREYVETFTNSAELGVISQKDYFEHSISKEGSINGYYIIEPDDFVYNPRISTSAPVGPINRNLLNRAGIMSPLYFIFRVIGIDKCYLSYFFKTKLWHKFMFLNGNTGARFDRLSITDEMFLEMPIYTPPSLEEQQKISAYFENLDYQITLQTQRLEKLKHIKSACLDKMFV